MSASSGPDRARAEHSPYKFADTGIPLMFRNAYQLGADKRRMVVRIAGGAEIMDKNGVFQIGKRNHLAVRKILWKAGVMIHAEDTGGMTSRTVRLEVGNGKFWLREAGEAEREVISAKRR